MWLFGTDDMLEVADNDILDMDASQDFTVMAVLRQWNTVTGGDTIMTHGGYWTFRAGYGSPNQIALSLNDLVNTEFVGSAVRTMGQLYSAFGFVDRGTPDRLGVILNTTESSGNFVNGAGSLVNASPLRIGASSGLGTFGEFELISAAVFRRVLTTDEIAAINTYYGTA